MRYLQTSKRSTKKSALHVPRPAPYMPLPPSQVQGQFPAFLSANFPAAPSYGGFSSSPAQLQSKKYAHHCIQIKYAESLGGVETLITYPTTQTHADVPKEIRERNGITESTLRLSVGIEDVKDLLAELEKVWRETKPLC